MDLSEELDPDLDFEDQHPTMPSEAELQHRVEQAKALGPLPPEFAQYQINKKIIVGEIGVGSSCQFESRLAPISGTSSLNKVSARTIRIRHRQRSKLAISDFDTGTTMDSKNCASVLIFASGTCPKIKPSRTAKSPQTRLRESRVRISRAAIAAPLYLDEPTGLTGEPRQPFWKRLGPKVKFRIVAFQNRPLSSAGRPVLRNSPRRDNAPRLAVFHSAFSSS
jgi:hypothetical protein